MFRRPPLLAPSGITGHHTHGAKCASAGRSFGVWHERVVLLVLYGVALLQYLFPNPNSVATRGARVMGGALTPMPAPLLLKAPYRGHQRKYLIAASQSRRYWPVVANVFYRRFIGSVGFIQPALWTAPSLNMPRVHVFSIDPFRVH